MAIDVTRYVHQLDNGRWIVAYEDEKTGQWYAPMTEDERRLTGCDTYFAGSIERLNCTSYATRRTAVNRACKIFG